MPRKDRRGESRGFALKYTGFEQYRKRLLQYGLVSPDEAIYHNSRLVHEAKVAGEDEIILELCDTDDNITIYYGVMSMGKRTDENGKERTVAKFRSRPSYSRTNMLFTERQMKFFSYESARTGNTLNGIVRGIVDAYIDRLCADDPRYASVMTVLNKGVNPEDIKNFWEMYGGHDVDSWSSGFRKVMESEREAREARTSVDAEEDGEDEYMDDVRGSGMRGGVSR